MTNFEYIKSLSVEEMAELIENAEDELMLPPCSSKYCPKHREDGHCQYQKVNCIKATLKWLNSEREGIK